MAVILLNDGLVRQLLAGGVTGSIREVQARCESVGSGSLVFDLATAAWIGRCEDALFLGPAGSGKSHCAQAIGHAVIQQGYRVLYREAHILLEELADATLDGNRKQHMELFTAAPLLIIDDLGMKQLPLTAAEELLEIIMRRYERASSLITSNRPVEDWGKLLGDSAAVSAMLDRLLHHGHVSSAAPEVGANQNQQFWRRPMTKAKAIRMPGKKRPAAPRYSDPEASHDGDSP
jgi:DNA replication protein DnaC